MALVTALFGGTIMDRLTKREGDMVYMVKDGELLAPRALSGQEVRQVLQKLADYEDEAERREKGCPLCHWGIDRGNYCKVCGRELV